MNFLLDTNIIAELCRPRPDPMVLRWSSRFSRLAISVITLEELRYGLAAKPAVRAEAWLNDVLLPLLDVYAVDQRAADWAGRKRGECRQQGRTLAQADGLIAATAAVNQLTLATRNTRDFAGLGVALLDPFQ